MRCERLRCVTYGIIQVFTHISLVKSVSFTMQSGVAVSRIAQVITDALTLLQ